MTKEYEQAVVKKFSSLFLDEIEATIRQREPTIFNRLENNPLIKRQKLMKIGEGFYSPTLDIGVGPYAFLPGSLNQVYLNILRKNKIKEFIRNISRKGFYFLKTGHNRFIDNSEFIYQNNNARCFLAIEIENKTTRKHFIGSSLNASMMGKIGIVICEGEFAEHIERLFGYIKEMIHRAKSPPIMQNVIWIKKEDFDEILNSSFK